MYKHCTSKEKGNVDQYIANGIGVMLKKVAKLEGLERQAVDVNDEFETKVDKWKIDITKKLNGQYMQDTKYKKWEDSWI